MKSNSKDGLGDRFKRNYEGPARHLLTRRLPVVIRLDGRAFHTFTRDLDKPFDNGFINAMVEAALTVCTEAQGCKLAYVQSDEASFLLTDYDTLETEAWFGYVKSKVESISAAIMTAAFHNAFRVGRPLPPAIFDARSFNLPENEVVNYFVWRAKDWARNSLSMYAQANYSHETLQGKNSKQMHEMLHCKGLNWTTDLTPAQRNGTFIHHAGILLTDRTNILPTYASILRVWERVKPKEPKETIHA